MSARRLPGFDGRSKSELFRDLLPLLNSGRIVPPRNLSMVGEMVDGVLASQAGMPRREMLDQLISVVFRFSIAIPFRHRSGKRHGWLRAATWRIGSIWPEGMPPNA